MKKLAHYFDNALTGFIVLTLFIALAYASNPYDNDKGYDPAVIARIGAMAVAPVARHKPAMTSQEKRAALVELFGSSVQ